MNVTEELARFACTLRYEDLPLNVAHKGKEVILDTLGASIYGSQMPWSRALIELAEEASGRPEATVWATPVKAPAAAAALVNGTTGHGFELDDYHSGAKLHPGVAVVPAALAVAERTGTRGRDLIAAVVAGYEATIRTCLASVTSTWARGFHLTGVFGGFGAAAAAGSLLGLNVLQMRNALGLAATQAAGLLMAAVAEGAMSKRIHGGKAASNGVLAALLAQKGFTASTRVFEAPEGSFYKAYADRWDLSRITDGLGKRFVILESAYKPYACCGSVHSSIDCVLALRSQHNITPGMVDRVVAKNSRIVQEQTGWEYQPGTQFTAQMSLQYCLAAALLEGEVSVAQFREDLLADPRVLNLARRVHFEVDPEMDRTYPTRFPAIVDIHLKDGRVLSHRVEGPKGSPQSPMTYQEVQDKFRVLARSRLSEDGAESIVREVDRLEDLEDVGRLTRHLSVHGVPTKR